MALDWLARDRGPSVADLIARRHYGKAIDLVREQLQHRPTDDRLRLQLADVLVLEGRAYEAVPIFEDLASQYANAGFAAKSIAVLKRIQKIEPGRRDVAERLAAQLEEKLHRSGATNRSLPARAPAMAMFGMEELEPEPTARPAATPEPATPRVPLPPLTPASAPAALPPPSPAMSAPGLGPMSSEPALEALPLDDLSADGERVVATPLFPDFSKDELVAVMGGLQLVTFEPGDVIVAEGEAGDSLFLLTSGTVKAFVRDPNGHLVLIRRMQEGDFFGEISVLTGKPRTATVTAAAPCELLELDRETLDSITATFPRVREVIEDFYVLRANNQTEARIRRGDAGDPRA